MKPAPYLHLDAARAAEHTIDGRGRSLLPGLYDCTATSGAAKR
jgi:hypothetical protein